MFSCRFELKVTNLHIAHLKMKARKTIEHSAQSWLCLKPSPAQ